MKDPENNHDPSATWLDDALREFFGAPAIGTPVEPLQAELRQHCRDAALGALDLLQMQQCRPRVAATPGSLQEHFKELAQLAEVSLSRVFNAVGIKPAGEAPDVTSIRGLTQLAQHLGLTRDEAAIRLRWGFARVAGAVLPTDLPTSAAPVRDRCALEVVLDLSQLDESLRRCEARYSPTHRAELCAAINLVDEAYAQDREGSTSGDAPQAHATSDRPPVKPPRLAGEATLFSDEVCLLNESCSLPSKLAGQRGTSFCDLTFMLLHQLGARSPSVGTAAADYLRSLWHYHQDNVLQCFDRFTKEPISLGKRRRLERRLKGSRALEVCGFQNHTTGVEPDEALAWLRDPKTELYKGIMSPRLRVFVARVDAGSKRFDAALVRRPPGDHFILVNSKFKPGTKDWLNTIAHEFFVHVLPEPLAAQSFPADPPEDQSKGSVFALTQIGVDADEKRNAARWAANEIPLASGAGVFLDSGSQCLFVYEVIRELIRQHRFANLAIFTNSFLILEQWKSDHVIPELAGTQVEMAGDFFDAPHLAFYGQALPAKLLSGEFRPAAVYIGTSGIEFDNDRVLLGYHAGDPEKDAKKVFFRCYAKARVILVTPHKIGNAGGRVFDMLSVEGPRAPIYLVTTAPEPNTAAEEQFRKAQEAFRSQGLRDALARKGVEMHWITLERNLTGIPKPVGHIIVPEQEPNRGKA